MKKTLGVVAAATLAAMPVMGVFADTISVTDKLELTIEDNCSFAVAENGHADGTGEWADDGITLKATVENGETYTNLGSTTFAVTCNDKGGSAVTVATPDLSTGETTGAKTIAYNAAAPGTTNSSWVINKGTVDSASYVSKNGEVWNSSNGSVSGVTFKVIYAAGISATQEAGVYKGDVVYTLTHPDAQ